MNEVWDLIENFFVAFNITFIPRNDNQRANSLALVAGGFKTPIDSQLRCEIEMRHRRSVR